MAQLKNQILHPLRLQEPEELAALKRETLARGKALPDASDGDGQEAAPKSNARSASDHPEADATAKKARTATTPPTLKNLLPNQGKSSKEVWILRNPKTFGYQIRYPTGSWEGFGDDFYLLCQNSN